MTSLFATIRATPVRKCLNASATVLTVALAWFAPGCGNNNGGGDGAPSPDGSHDSRASDMGTTHTDVTGNHDTGTNHMDAGSDVVIVTAPDAGPVDAPQNLSPNIVVDQFGYRTSAEKIAVVRNPQMGFDTSSSFTPGTTYQVVDAHSGQSVFQGAPMAWNNGNTDPSSGDKAWWFDFSSVTTAGQYIVVDTTHNVRSDVFEIADDVYRNALVQSVRMLYYQRDGIAHSAQNAGQGWADGMAHPQDATCFLYSAVGNNSMTHDVHGGWNDAGDQNKYTNWEAMDVMQLLRAYRDNPAAFTDDYNIPESGNGVPDVLDEAKWALDWILRMQNTDGSVLSVVGHTGASPPSSDTGPCKYGPATTAASFSAAAALAFGAVIFQPITQYQGYSTQLSTAAVNAWNWAQARPGVTFMNSQNGVAAGEQEITDPYELSMRTLEAALYLWAATGTQSYQQYFDSNYSMQKMISNNQVDIWQGDTQEAMLDYTAMTGATASVVQAIQAAYRNGVENSRDSFGAQTGNVDPYFAHVQQYVWGSNAQVGTQGTMFYDMITARIDPAMDATSARYAERYVHYFHGVNPLQLVYLSNMGSFGAEKSVTRFFHTWFSNTSVQWNAVGVSTYGPPPGYLPGGPNPTYNWDGCCPNGCSGNSCGAAVLSPPAGQPPQKSYLDFNGNWPLDSWQVTEPDDGYQVNYIRLLSKFVP